MQTIIISKVCCGTCVKIVLFLRHDLSKKHETPFPYGLRTASVIIFGTHTHARAHTLALTVKQSLYVLHLCQILKKFSKIILTGDGNLTISIYKYFVLLCK
jgi:hypothetical protein